MATTTAAFTIATSLAEDPSIHLKKWLQQAEFMLTRAGRAEFEDGLMSLDIMLTNTQYRAKHGHSRRTPKMPPRPLVTATVAEVEFFKREKELYTAYVTAHDAAKLALLESVGPAIRDALDDPDTGFLKLRIGTIIDYVKRTYGEVTEDDIDKIDLQLATPYDPATDLATFIANLTTRFAPLLDSLDQAKSERDKLRILDAALSADVTAAAAIQAGKYDAAKAGMKRTYKWAATEVLKAFPALHSTTATSGLLNHVHGTTNLVLTGNPAVDVVMLQRHQAALLAKLHNNDVQFAGAAAAVGKPYADGPSSASPSNGAPCYCFKHGWRFDHGGAGCIFLQALPDSADKTKMMAATNPRVKVGTEWGCDAVQASAAYERSGKQQKQQHTGKNGNKAARSVSRRSGRASASAADCAET